MLSAGLHSIQGWRNSPRGSQANTPHGTPRSVSPGSVQGMDRSIPPSPGNYSPDYGSPGDSPRAASPGAVAGAKSSSPAPIAHTMPKIRELNFSKSVAESLTEALDTSADRRAARGVAGFEPSRSSGDEQSARILRWLKREPGVLSRDLEALRRVRDVCGCYMVRKWDQLDPAKREAMIHSNRFDSLQTFLRSIEGKAFQSEGGISPASVSEFAALAAVASSSDVKHSLHRGPSQRKLASDPVLKECARIISEPQASVVHVLENDERCVVLEVARLLAQVSSEARALALAQGDLPTLVAQVENAYMRSILRLEDVMVC